jgi:hypothetical protein
MHLLPQPDDEMRGGWLFLAQLGRSGRSRRMAVVGALGAARLCRGAKTAVDRPFHSQTLSGASKNCEKVNSFMRRNSLNCQQL